MDSLTVTHEARSAAAAQAVREEMVRVVIMLNLVKMIRMGEGGCGGK